MTPTQRGPNTDVRLKGLALSKGCAVANVCLFNEKRHSNLPIYKIPGDGIAHEVERVQRAIEIAGKKLDAIRSKVEQRIGHAEAEIFVAHRMILDDPELLKAVRKHIETDNINAEAAITNVLDSYEAKIQALDDEYIRERATDFGEIKRRLLDVLGNMQPELQCDREHCQKGKNRIVIAEELTPSLTVDIDPDATLGFITERGGVNSHAAILARALGIPAVSAIQGIRDHVGCGTNVLVNGTTGEVILWPTAETVVRELGTEPRVPGEPKAVGPVEGLAVMGNVNLLSDVELCLKMKAEGIGLYRTEFEIIAEGRFLTEDELFERYSTAVELMDGRKTVFRLFDIGSDKSLPFMNIPEEENPSLGLRGTRLLLDRADVLRTQARALARASKGREIHVMYPMIIEASQFLKIRDIFDDAIKDIPRGEIRQGIMFEVPSACLQARELFEVADFASIGTNDLTQYLFAVDRDNELVSYDYSPNRTVFWNLIKDIADAAHDAGKHLSVCGEMAGDPEYVTKLVEAGIEAVSVTARRIPQVRLALLD